MFDFNLIISFMIILLFALSCTGVALFLRRTRRRIHDEGKKPKTKAALACLIIGDLFIILSVIMYIYIHGKVRGTFFLFKPMAKDQSEPARMFMVVIFTIGLAIAVIGLFSLYLSKKKDASSSE